MLVSLKKDQVLRQKEDTGLGLTAGSRIQDKRTQPIHSFSLSGILHSYLEFERGLRSGRGRDASRTQGKDIQ